MGHDEFTGEKKPCDLVMQGGGLSDVAYPLAIVELAKKHRFGSVGGTSAGALAAAIAAAGEYARETGGFQRIAAIPHDISTTLFSQFQPERHLSPLFGMLVALLAKESAPGKTLGVLSAAVLGYRRATLAGILPGLLVFAVALDYRDWGWLAFSVLLAIVGLTLSLVLRIARAVAQELPQANFGVCSGQTVPGSNVPAVTDWLADTIDHVAGNLDKQGRPDRPLTFGDLTKKNASFELAMVTTDLSMKRPYHLPFREVGHFFSKRDFEKLFPPRVIAHMCRTNPLPPDPRWIDCPDDLYAFPAAKDLPIVVAARMSLSFPLIFQAVPVYKCDLTLKQGSDQPRKCLFADGGLTSNFPIHFFDRLWPNSPTFAVSFDDFSPERHVERVEMTTDLREGDFLPILPINGIGGFLDRLLSTARTWPDNLQSVLPGYRERVVHVHLTPDEGGYNLKMPFDVILRVAEYGKTAGALAGKAFNMDEHRWRRFLIAMAETEQVLDELADSHDTRSAGGESFGEFLDRYGPRGRYRPTNRPGQDENAWKRETLRRARLLVRLGRLWRKPPTIRSGRIPEPECDLRISPKQ